MGKRIYGRTVCEIEGCGRPHYSRGWCKPHHGRWQRRGDPMAHKPILSHGSTLEERFWAKVRRSDGGCWLWLGKIEQTGYGRFSQGQGPAISAHRFAYSAVHGPIPTGLSVLHHCDNPPCCNPSHLWLGTHADNMQDMARKGRGRGRRHRNYVVGSTGVFYLPTMGEIRPKSGGSAA